MVKEIPGLCAERLTRLFIIKTSQTGEDLRASVNFRFRYIGLNWFSDLVITIFEINVLILVHQFQLTK